MVAAHGGVPPSPPPPPPPPLYRDSAWLCVVFKTVLQPDILIYSRKQAQVILQLLLQSEHLHGTHPNKTTIKFTMQSGVSPTDVPIGWLQDNNMNQLPLSINTHYNHNCLFTCLPVKLWNSCRNTAVTCVQLMFYLQLTTNRHSNHTTGW